MSAVVRKLQRQFGKPPTAPRPSSREKTGSAPTYPADVWTPLPDREDGTPRPQSVALEHEADEMYYGGGAGGGKTDLLLGLALTAHRRSIIFRRETEQVTGIEERLIEILGSDAGYNRNKHRLHASVGKVTRRVRLGGMQRERDWQRYQGQPFDLTAFDELPHFLRSQFRAVIGWNRTATPGQRTRVVGAGNPPVRPEEEWVLSEFAPWLDPEFEATHGIPMAEPGALMWYRYLAGKPEGQDIRWLTREMLSEDEDGRLYFEETPEASGDEASGDETSGDGASGDADQPRRVYPKSRTFVPALVDDNPVYMETGYAERLEAMPEPLRSLMRSGSFSAGVEDNPWQVIPTAWVDAAQARWREMNADGAFVPGVPKTALGVDPARGGKDETVIASRWGEYVGELETHSGSATPDGPLVAALVVAAGASSSCRAIVDVIGIGSSVYDALPEEARVAFGAGNKSERRDKSGAFGFANLRAEMWWLMRERLDPASGENVALPPDRQLRADLCAPRFTVTARGILIEEKKDIKKRIGRSPDRADAVLQSFYEDNTPEALISFGFA